MSWRQFLPDMRDLYLYAGLAAIAHGGWSIAAIRPGEVAAGLLMVLVALKAGGR